MTAFLYDLIYTVPLCVASVILTNMVTAADTTTAVSVAAIVCAAAVVLFGHLKSGGRLLLSGAGVTIIAAVWFFDKGVTLRDNMYIFRILLIAVACYAIHTICEKNPKLKVGLMIAFAAPPVIMMVTHRNVDRTYFGMILFSVVAFAVEKIQEAWKKEGDTGIRKHVVYILPFLAVMFIPLFLIRIPDDPYDWKFVKELAESIRSGYEIIIQTFAPEGGWDSGSSMGFSEKGDIGGGVRNNPYKALTVYSSAENDYRLYLEGRSFDSFDGRKWTKTDDSDLDYRVFDLLETTAGAVHEGKDFVDDHMKRVRLHIIYEGVRTKCAFAPLKSADEATVKLDRSGGDLKFTKGKKGDYQIYYYRINRDDPDYIRMLKDKRMPDKQDWDTALLLMSSTLKKQYSYEDYLKYREEIYGRYALPVQLSDRANGYMQKLLSGAGSDYEKLERIEELLEGFEYSTAPGELPEEVKDAGEFIDYLLFENKEGFCIHYATAFVLLARSQNIPARYVQGYSVLSKTTDFEVRSDRTHAWPEAYIEGAGWVTFEPTPGFRQTSGWEIKRTGKGTGVTTNYRDQYEHNAGEQPDTDGSRDDDAEDAKRLSEGLRAVVAAILFGISFVLIFAVSDNLYRRYRYRRMDDREKIRFLCKRNMKTLRLLGAVPKSGETLGEFAARAKDFIPGEVLVFTDVYERILYADDMPEHDEVLRMEDCRKRCGVFVRRSIIGRFLGKMKKTGKN